MDEETSTALKFNVVDLDEPLSPEFRAAIEKEGIPFPETAEQERIRSSWVAGSRCSGRSTMMEAQAVYEDSFDGDLWIDMLGARNRIAHAYSDKRLQELVDMIRAKYIPALQDLQMYVLARYGPETLEVESNQIVSE